MIWLTRKLLGLALFMLAAALYAEPQAPYPGMWRCGTSPSDVHYCPCYFSPYKLWTDPDTGRTMYYRYDATRLELSPPKHFAGQGGPNHTFQWYGDDGYLYPIEPQPKVDNYYPVPPASSNLGAEWAASNSAPYPQPGDYSAAMKNNPIWKSGYNYYKPFMDADPGCKTNITPLPIITPTFNNTPTNTAIVNKTPTPTPAASSFGADQIEWLYHFGVTNGCATSPLRYCPTQLISREQMAVYFWNFYKAEHPGAVLPPCTGVFADLGCAP